MCVHTLAYSVLIFVDTFVHRFGTNSNYTLYYDDFITLYVKTVMAVVQQENPRRQYLSSSPSNGLDSEREGFVAQDPDSELYGDSKFLIIRSTVKNVNVCYAC